MKLVVIAFSVFRRLKNVEEFTHRRLLSHFLRWVRLIQCHLIYNAMSGIFGLNGSRDRALGGNIETGTSIARG